MNLRARLRDEAGNALVVVVIVSFVVAGMATLSLQTGRQADWSSASDRNRQGSLGVAEAGIQSQLKRIQAQTSIGYVPTFAPLDGSTSQGTYHVETTHCPADITDPNRIAHQGWCDGMSVTRGYVMDSTATAGTTLKRKRHVRVSLVPPSLFPPTTKYVMYSATSISFGNNDVFNDSPNGPADVYANDSITLGQGAVVKGSVTSAKSYIDSSASGTQITGNAWSGGYHPSGWAMKLTVVGGWAKASIANATNLVTCDGQLAANYTVYPGTTTGSVTTWGSISGPNRGIDHPSTCTAAAAQVPTPAFTYNRYNYSPAPVEFGSVAAFNAYFIAHPPTAVSGTYYVNDAMPSEGNRLDLSGWNIGGDLTVITNTPIYTDGISDATLPAGSKPSLVLVSEYTPAPAGTPCTAANQNSECAIYVGNHLNVNADGTCQTATLVYADHGPVAIKNTSNNPANPGTMCGTVVSQGTFLYNNQNINYDPRLDSVIGFGADTYQLGRWEELPAS